MGSRSLLVVVGVAIEPVNLFGRNADKAILELFTRLRASGRREAHLKRSGFGGVLKCAPILAQHVAALGGDASVILLLFAPLAFEDLVLGKLRVRRRQRGLAYLVHLRAQLSAE